jgi:hypothetical protein
MLPLKEPGGSPLSFWRDAVPLVDGRRGYLQQLDDASRPLGPLRITQAFGCL